MAVEYDLVVIGGTTVARHAAVAAARLQARVALVEPESISRDLAMLRLYRQIGRVSDRLKQYPWLCNPTDRVGDPENFTAYPSTPTVRLDLAMEWAKAAVSNLEERDSPSILASWGIDVVTGRGEFCRKPHLGFVVNDRYLRSRAYLIATGSRVVLPAIDGLLAAGATTPADIWQRLDSQQLPKSWVVIGGNAIAIELAQTLVRLGAEVTLAVKGAQILTVEDPEAAFLIQAQLEAEGVRILTETEVTQVKCIEEKKWLQAGNKAIEVDEILVATGYQPQVKSLNLEGVGVKMNGRKLSLNDKLQTTNPRIYACHYRTSQVAEYEARIALKNALFFPAFKVDYRAIPTAVFSDPMAARVGLTEPQARERYGKDVLVLQQYFKSSNKAQTVGETTGFWKIIVRRNGEILGAHIVGVEAAELIHPIALCMRQKLKVEAIASMPHIADTLSEIDALTARLWHEERLKRNHRLLDWLEGFFHWRRSLL
ncbi:MAG: NAD(P)/FAD-dependent oxidoreductase [Cyanosarcina radialis HA8281-LM2]|nr:NAD(P)/FAD-dependent oxidoreductase [Cyanosarcina radialis HA8281-LM2]